MKNLLYQVSIWLLVFASTAWTQLPERISYQGILRGPDNELIPDGTYRLRFDLYSVPVGGSSIWEETHNASIRAGLFNVQLGSINPFGNRDELDFMRPYWLGVRIDDNPEELSPRIQFTATAYSMGAKLAKRAVMADRAEVANSVDGLVDSAAYADSARIADAAIAAFRATNADTAFYAETAASATRAHLADSADRVVSFLEVDIGGTFESVPNIYFKQLDNLSRIFTPDEVSELSIRLRTTRKCNLVILGQGRMNAGRGSFWLNLYKGATDDSLKTTVRLASTGTASNRGLSSLLMHSETLTPEHGDVLFRLNADLTKTSLETASITVIAVPIP